MNFTQFLSILRARRRMALLVLGLTVGLAVLASLLLPKQYTAVASVVVDVKPDPLAAVLYNTMGPSALVATQVDVIQSDRVAKRVISNLKLADSPQLREQWRDDTDGQGDLETWLATALQKKLDVKPSRESSVILISYKAATPQFAAALANAFVQAYLETSLELRTDPAKQYSTFFDTRAKDAREVLERAQAKLSAFQKEKSIVATDERLDDEMLRLNELTSQAVMMQALAAESNSRQAQVRGGAADRLQEVLNHPLIASLKADLSRSEAKLQEISSRLGDSNPQVTELKASIASLRSRIASETQRVTEGVSVTGAVNRQREAEIKSALDTQRAKVLRLKSVRDEGAVLQRDVESAQLAYQAVVSRYNQSSLESQTTQSNINRLTSAAPPLEPSSPKLVLNTVLAFLLGSLLAVGIVLVMEIMDRRIRSVEDVTAALGLAVVGVLPTPGSRRWLGKHKLAQQRMIGRLTAPGKGA